MKLLSGLGQSSIKFSWLAISEFQLDEIVKYSTEKELFEILRMLRPDVRILGSDYEGKHFTGTELNIPIYYHKRNHGYSTSSLREKIKTY